MEGLAENTRVRRVGDSVDVLDAVLTLIFQMVALRDQLSAPVPI